MSWWGGGTSSTKAGWPLTTRRDDLIYGRIISFVLGRQASFLVNLLQEVSPSPFPRVQLLHQLFCVLYFALPRALVVLCLRPPQITPIPGVLLLFSLPRSRVFINVTLKVFRFTIGSLVLIDELLAHRGGLFNVV